MRRDTWENVCASRSIAAAELTFMSTRFSHCARTSGCSRSGRWVERKRYRPYLRPSAAIRTACSMASACARSAGFGRADVVRLVDDDEHGFAAVPPLPQRGQDRGDDGGALARVRQLADVEDRPRQSGGSWSMSGRVVGLRPHRPVRGGEVVDPQREPARRLLERVEARPEVAQRVLGVRHRLGDPAEAVVELGVLDRVELEREGLLVQGQAPVPDTQAVHAVVAEDLDPVRQFLGPAHAPRRLSPSRSISVTCT